MRKQEKPVFEAGDRFRLTQTIEAFGGEVGTLDILTYRAGLKGTVVKKEIWFEDSPNVWCYYLRFEAYPGRLVVWVKPLAEVAAKAVEGI